jgi:hypothetical protein
MPFGAYAHRIVQSDVNSLAALAQAVLNPQIFANDP